MIFTFPLALPLLLLALLPLFASVIAERAHPSLAVLPPDPLSTALDWALRGLGSLAFAGLALGLSGAALPERTIEHVGKGAHISLLIDRSSSMDETFAGHSPSGGEESKSQAAKRLLRDFVQSRDHDSYGINLFSTSPMPVFPINDHRDTVQAAIAAIDRPALAFTDIGRGVALALDTIAHDTPGAEKAVLIVSDGAAVIDRRVQEALRTEFAKLPLRLYWLYLRTQGSPGIHDVPKPGEEDTPSALPERHLHRFFESLKIPYRAYEAESPEAVKSAIDEISRVEQRPVLYVEHIPRYPLFPWLFGLSAAALVPLVLASFAALPLMAGRSGGAPVSVRLGAPS